MTPPLYRGPRCASCGGDHFPIVAPTVPILPYPCDRAERPLPDAEPEPGTDTAPSPNGPQGPSTAATVDTNGRLYFTAAGLRAWLRRQRP